MWRSFISSIAARSARRLLGAEGYDARKTFASSSATLTHCGKRQLLWQRQCRDYHHRPYPLFSEKSGDDDSTAAALKAADDNAQRFLIAATGGTLAFAAYVAFGKGESPPKKHGADHGKTALDEEKAHGASEEKAPVSSQEESGKEDAPQVGAASDEETGQTEPAGSEPEALEEGEEKGECGFCAFMKAGPCGEVFTAWEKCVDDAEAQGENIVEQCMEKTMALRECMTKSVEYYGVVLEAEKEIGNEAEKATAAASEQEGEPGESREVKELLDSFEEVLDAAKSVLETSEQRSKA